MMEKPVRFLFHCVYVFSAKTQQIELASALFFKSLPTNMAATCKTSNANISPDLKKEKLIVDNPNRK